MPLPSAPARSVRALAPLLPLLAALALAGCTTLRETQPQRSAREQLLMSTAADRAAERLNLKLPDGSKVFVDAQYVEGTDSKYAVAAVRDRLLRGGAALMEKREQAEAVVEIRVGALSIDEAQMLIGIPSWQVPIPLTGDFKLPELSLYKERERLGLAKLAAASYAVADGRLIDASGPHFGFARDREWTVLLFLSWRSSDLPVESRP